MSYRHVLALTESLRDLGYPRVVSLEAFRQPNFDLVADLLAWLVKAYDPLATIPSVKSLGSEAERVAFVTAVAEQLASRAQLRINPRRLYAADSAAVGELIKLVDLFARAALAFNGTSETSISGGSSSPSAQDDAAKLSIRPVGPFHYVAPSVTAALKRPAVGSTGAAMGTGGFGSRSAGDSMVAVDLSSKAATIRAARELAQEITLNGAHIFDLLDEEAGNKTIRAGALARAIDIPTLSAAAQSSLASTQSECASLESTVTAMTGDAAALTAKIEKKRADLDRRLKRLKSMQGVRPAYMDEYERVEADLKKVFDVYVRSVKNVAWLENAVEEGARAELDRDEEAELSLKRLQDRIKQEELNMLRGAGIDGLEDESDVDDEEDGDEMLVDDDDDDEEEEDGQDGEDDDDFGLGRGGGDDDDGDEDDEGLDPDLRAVLGRQGGSKSSGRPSHAGQQRASRIPGNYSDNDASEGEADQSSGLDGAYQNSGRGGSVPKRTGAYRPGRHASGMGAQDNDDDEGLLGSENDDDEEEDEDDELDDDLVAASREMLQQQLLQQQQQQEKEASSSGGQRLSGGRPGAVGGLGGGGTRTGNSHSNNSSIRMQQQQQQQQQQRAQADDDDEDDDALLSGIVDYGDDGGDDDGSDNGRHQDPASDTDF